MAFKLFLILWSGLFSADTLSQISEPDFLGISFALLLLALWLWKRTVSRLFLMVAWGMLCLVLGERSSQDQAGIHIHVSPKSELNLSGRIAGVPQKNALGLQFFLKAEKIVSAGECFRVEDQYQVIVPGFSGALPLPQTAVSVQGVIHPLKESEEWDSILKLRGISAKLWASPGHLKISGLEPAPRWMRWIADLETRLRNALHQTTVDEVSQDALFAILFGDKKGLSPELKQSLIHVNVFHIFAISGAHFVLLGHILLWILGFLGVPKPSRSFFAIPLLWVFLALVQFPPSACRAFLMLCLFWMASHCYRSPHRLSVVGVSGILQLLWEPQNHSDPGFILSYVAVIALLGPGLEMDRYFKRFWRPWAEKYEMDPGLSGRLKTAEKLITASLFSLAAWLGTAPVVIYYFKVFSPVSVLSNLVAALVVEWILVCTLLAVFFGQVWGLFAEAYAQVATFLTKVLTKSMLFLESIPGAYLSVFNFDAWDLLFWYALLWSGFEACRFHVERLAERRLGRREVEA